MAEIIVGRDGVNPGTELLDHVGNELGQELRRRRARDEGVAVAQTAFVNHVVEIERLRPAENRTNDLARGAGDAAMHHRDSVAQRRLLGILRIELVVGLGVVDLELDFASENATRGVQGFGGELDAIDLGSPQHFQRAGQIEQNADTDRIGPEGGGFHQERRRQKRRRTHCIFQDSSAVYDHCDHLLPVNGGKKDQAAAPGHGEIRQLHDNF
jgi:hypothetical protein